MRLLAEPASRISSAPDGRMEGDGCRTRKGEGRKGGLNFLSFKSVR